MGLGTMGSQFASVFLMAGHDVLGYEPNDSQWARAQKQIRQGLLTLGNERIEQTFTHGFRRTTRLEDVQHVEFVLEAVPEKLDLKQRLHQSVSRLNPNAILATNTSAFRIVDVFAFTEGPHRVIGTHWFNPPHLVPGVEVILSEKTSVYTREIVMRLLRELGKEPVLVEDSPGFVINRLQMALVNEAVRCVEEKVVSPNEMDILVRATLGFRLAQFGPLSVADWAGLDIYKSIFEYLKEHLGSRFDCPQMLNDMVDRGELGIKTRRGFFQYTGDFETLLSNRDKSLRKQGQVWSHGGESYDEPK
ncbi:3-hydroxybutyryl-CoA dehydrogenase [Alicyclobacillus acidoterrestris]|nr:3-hydroxybutyryl-CoA dehydrogenase [Alicyclobacillus acidoterrestris]